MTQRLMDYALVAIVILFIFGLFRLSRILMLKILDYLKRKIDCFGRDRLLFTAFMFLLAGLIFLPSFTAVLALFNERYLTGGMIFHLLMVAFSIVLFSISEDMFREYTGSKLECEGWSKTLHLKRISLPTMVFWAIGCLFLSPLFYSGLTIILLVFYIYALSCGSTAEDNSGKPD